MATPVRPAALSQPISFLSSQRFRLPLLFLAVALVPLALLGVFSYFTAARGFQAEAEQQLRLTNSLLNNRIASWLHERQSDLTVVAADDAAIHMNAAAFTPVLQNLVKSKSLYEAVLLISPAGKVIAASTPDGVGIDVTDRAYFKTAIQGQATASDAIVSRLTGNVVVPIAVPVRRDGQVVGVVSGVANIADLTAVVQTAWIGQSGDAYLVDAEQRVVSTPRFAEAMKQLGLFQTRPELEARIDTPAVRQALAGESGVSAYPDYRGVPVIGAYSPIQATGWALVVEVDQAEALAVVASLGAAVLLVALALLVVVTLMALWVSRGLTRPLAIAVRALEHLGRGEQYAALEDSVRDAFLGRRDEFGALARALMAARTYLDDMAQAAETIADGDLTVIVTPRSDGDKLGNAFAQMVASLSRTIGSVAQNAADVRAASDQLAAAANQAAQATGQITTTIQQVARGTTQQTESVTHTAASMEQMKRAIDGVARGAQEQAAAVGKASSVTTAISAASEASAAAA